VRELGGRNPETTNNRMELVSVIQALQSLKTPLDWPIVLYTDSTYVIRGITQWIWGWRKRGWRNAEGKEVQNRDLWEELSRQVTRLKPTTIDWKYVRGHTGVPGNERSMRLPSLLRMENALSSTMVLSWVTMSQSTTYPRIKDSLKCGPRKKRSQHFPI